MIVTERPCIKKTKTKIISVLQYQILIVSKQPFIYASKERLICFTKPYNRRFKTAIYAFKKTHTSFFKNGRFFSVIYRRLETAFIWISETGVRFFRGVYWRLETTLYECF